ncbi:MAG: hypothetical protein JSV14_01250 [Deltaproteobacteria bacterium]|nr:MAG: hypothetical protein JSV14_01250 [Deltaproteobacteria bacterium]
MKHTRKKSNGMRKDTLVLPIILVAVVAVFLAMGESALAVDLDEANVFIEWNSTDSDHGIQFFWDSEGFTQMTVTNSGGTLDIGTTGNVALQGLTETAIESVEPDESEQTRAEFFARFPAETYLFSGTSTEGDPITGEAELTHDLLEPVLFTKINLPVIEWIEPELNDVTGEDLEVVGYELVVELVVLVEEDGEEEERVFTETTVYPAGVSKHIVSNRFMGVIKNPPGEIEELKVEILATEPSGNRTITEQAVE